jgi:hypothetical protein
MTPRQPQLDWIKEVLADVAADCELPPMAFGSVRQRETADAQSMNDPPAAPDGEDRLICPSWRLIRLAVTRNS